VASPAIDLSRRSLTDIAAQLDRDGLVRLDNVVSPEWLERARSEVTSHLSGCGERDITIYRPGDKSEAPAHQLVADPALQAFFAGLTTLRCPNGMPERDDIHSVLRILAGPVRGGIPYWFHYDASVVTMVVPVIIPEAGPGQSGELILFPNRRPFRTSVLMNIAEKLATQNPLYRWRVKRRFEQTPHDHMVRLAPGSAHLFWGYRTVHGNVPCAPNAVRATLMLHYGDPHRHHPLLRAAKAVRMAAHSVRAKG
jgi:hypothetical protein